MSAEYQQLTHHVAMRDGLPSAIRPTLLEEAQQDWKAHPRFAGKARFFMKIHRQLLDGADWLADRTEQLLDTPQSTLVDQINASGIQQRTAHLLHFAHGHHEIEDHGYFPQFIQLYPNLEHAMQLLDGDHKVLDETLDGTETGLADLMRNPNRDSVGLLHRNAAALKKIMHRHITDEEDIIIPIFLRHG
ncbi:MAG: hemerythrin-like domain-containing protein [Gammaproteobacteria bacterium]|jgi:hemerythrin-like domain-containing protein